MAEKCRHLPSIGVDLRRHLPCLSLSYSSRCVLRSQSFLPASRIDATRLDFRCYSPRSMPGIVNQPCGIVQYPEAEPQRRWQVSVWSIARSHHQMTRGVEKGITRTIQSTEMDLPTRRPFRTYRKIRIRHRDASDFSSRSSETWGWLGQEIL